MDNWRVAVFFQYFAQVMDAGEGIVEGDFDMGATGRGVHAANAWHGAQQVKHTGDVGGVQHGS